MAEMVELTPKVPLPTHTVDVQKLGEFRQAHPNLSLPNFCCDKATTVFCSMLCFWLLLFIVGPIVTPYVVAVSAPWTTIVFIVLPTLGALLCCYHVLPILKAALCPPAPPDHIEPLMEKGRNNTHRTSEVRRVAVVFNPNAGKGKARSMLENIVVPRFRAKGLTVEEFPTQYVNHAREIAFGIDVANFDALVVMGGDGTYHEAANGLLSRGAGAESLPLALIPMGSGNAHVADFRQNMKRQGQEVSVYSEHEPVIEWMVDRVIGGHSCCIDAIEVTTCGQTLHAASMMYFGMLAEVDILAEPLRCIGPTRFDVVSIWQCLKLQNMPLCRVELTKPDGSKQKLTNIPEEGGSPWLAFVLDLGQHWSDVMRSSPHSVLDDGFGEMNLIKADISRSRLLQALLLLGTGAAESVTGCIETHTFTDITVTFPAASGAEAGVQEGVINVDGEIFRHDGSVRAKILPRHLRVFCDPNDECLSAAGPGQPLLS